MTDAYSTSLKDLYQTKKLENSPFSEEFLIELSWQLLNQIDYMAKHGLSYKG